MGLFRIIVGLSSMLATACGVNLRPVIGILTNPAGNWPPYTSYFASSYNKWLESGGARVAPISYDLPPEEFDSLISSVNGFLFTGGGNDFVDASGAPNAFSLAAKRILDTVTTAAAQGEWVPLWGTCQGFQLIAYLLSGLNATVPATGFDSENLTLPLDFTAEAASSRLWGSAPAGVVDIFQDYDLNVTYNAHHNGGAKERRVYFRNQAARHARGLLF